MFVHADLQGALVTLVKSPNPATPVPPLTISQASASVSLECPIACWSAQRRTSARVLGPCRQLSACRLCHVLPQLLLLASAHAP